MTASPPPFLSRTPYELCDAAHDYPAWTGPPRRSILICSQPRSGTTMLGEALYFAGGFGCPLEYIHFGFRPGFEARWRAPDMRRLIDAVRRHRTDPSGTMSIKLFWRDVADLAADLAPGAFPDLKAVPAVDVAPETYIGLAALLRDTFPDPLYIYLDRRDRLRQAVSSVSATQTGIFRRIASANDAVLADSAHVWRVDYDFDAISRLIAGNAFCHAHWHALFAATGIRVHGMTYEALVSDHVGSVGRLLRALGHAGPVPPVRMERQSTARSEALMLRFLRDQRDAARP